MPIIDKYRDELMNPLSHNNIYAPIYRQEIKDCLSILKKAETEIRINIVIYTSKAKLMLPEKYRTFECK